MSLILEALRKSEAERRRGLPPDLHAELPPVGARRSRGFPGWWWALLAIAAVALGAWLLRKPPAPTASPSTAGAPVADAGAVDTPPATADASVASAAAPAPASPPASPTVLPQSTPAASVEKPAPVEPPDPQPAASNPAASNPATQQIPPPPAPAPPTSTAASDPVRVLSLAELDADTRQALPPLELSMHLWNDDPSRRFVILDGRRMGEGDRIGEASIVRIERDGVLLEWHGRGIRLPID